MEKPLNLILSLPQEGITATSLGIEGFAWHRSPGSGKYFKGRSVHVDLALKDGMPEFQFLDEGGWRDAFRDTVAALESATHGKRTKTALSNNAFSVTPVSAYRRMYLVKTGGEVLEMTQPKRLAEYQPGVTSEGMEPAAIAAAVGKRPPDPRVPRLYMVLAPVEFILLSNLTPEEYVWYATRRPGKQFRQVMFTELKADQSQMAAEVVYQDARRELLENATKKTKTIVTGDCINRVPFNAWVGYFHKNPGGVYAGDQRVLDLWSFPEQIPRAWDRATG